MKFMKLILLSLIVGACINPPKDNTANEKANENQQSIQELEARIIELNQRLLESESVSSSSDSAEIAQLRAELTALMETTTRLQEQRFIALEDQVANLQVSINENTANLVELSLLRQRVNEEALTHTPEPTISIDALSSITARLESLEDSRLQIQARIDNAIQAAETRWQEQLTLAIEANSGELTQDVQEMIIQERERLQIELAGLQRQLEQFESTQQSIYREQGRLETDLDSFRNQQDSDRESQTQASQMIRAQIERIESRFDNLANIEVAPNNDNILTQINRRMYEPCYEELSEDPYCLSQATTVRRLGGEFISPMRFERNRAGLLSYLAMSGVSLEALMDHIDAVITPGSENTRQLFQRCMEQDNLQIEHLIAPQHQWPRLVILALVMEKAEASLNAQRNAGELTNTVSPVTHFVAWWRSPCYQLGISPGSDGQGDHTHGAALDLSFAAQPNKDTFEFYREFIRVHFWENDTFGVLYPLGSAELTMRIGVGLGHGHHNNGQMHLGLFSEESDSFDNRMQWTYGSRNHGRYEDRL